MTLPYPKKPIEYNHLITKACVLLKFQRLCQNQINKRYYQHIDTTIDNRTIFRDLGKALAQLQNSMPQTLDNGFYYGMQHGDFQIGNIFYDPYTHTTIPFTLIDLGNFAEHKRLILDPLYFIYFLSITSYGKQ